MPQKIKQADGSEIEVFTQEEVQAREKEVAEKAKNEGVEEYKKAHPDQAEAVNKLQTDLAEANRKLEAAEADGDKSGQVARLRQERDDAQKKLTDEIQNLNKKIDGLIGDTKTEMLNKLAGADAELKKKIEFEFDNYRPGDTSKAGIIERMQKAYQLVTGNKPSPSIMDNISGAGDRGNGNGPTPEEKAKEPTKNEVAIGNVLGVTDEDRKKYKGKVNSSTAD